MRKPLIVFCGLLFVSGPALALKPCEELKSEIAAILDGKGVVNYTLTIVPNDQVGNAQVVGSCDGSTKKITYERGQPEAPAATPSAARPVAKPESAPPEPSPSK